VNEPSKSPVYDSPPPAPEPFYKTWIKALTKPNEQTFIDIANSPDVSPGKAYLWLVISYILSFLIISLVTLFGTSNQFDNLRTSLGSSAIALLCGAPIGAVIGVFFYSLEIAITQWVAKLFKGTGTYNQLIYSVAAFAAPMMLVSGLISALAMIPAIGICFSIIGILISLYTLFLMVTAVKGVNRFGWGEALGSVFLPGIVIGLLCGCVIVVIIMLLGPAIGDVFSTINQSLIY